MILFVESLEPTGRPSADRINQRKRNYGFSVSPVLWSSYIPVDGVDLSGGAEGLYPLVCLRIT
jgi:hypothetical protein